MFSSASIIDLALKSQSYTLWPITRSISETTDLPLPIPPVIAVIFMVCVFCKLG